MAKGLSLLAESPQNVDGGIRHAVQLVLDRYLRAQLDLRA
jgi:hypothetical protein